ncbi:ABC transporter permease subunit [Actinoplanes sp. NPDC026619]|uniref:ABC transporter permease n=1 Tax=Actinoplanes sp. NPDC026619 TaxID=3155798 RepID=UPI0033BFFDC0
MLPEVFIKAVRDDRRILTGWVTGAAAAGVAYASFYPQVSGGRMVDAIAGYPPAMREAFRLDDLNSAAGYLGSSVFGLILPLIAVFYGAATGARLVAGDEESGRLGLVLAHPASRTALVLQRFAALAVGASLLAAVVLLGMVAIRPAAELSDVTVAELGAQCLNLALLAIVFGALAIGIGAAFGKRILVFAVTAIIGIGAYALHSLGGQLGIERGRYFSPFHYYIGGEPLKNGWQLADAGTLLAVALVLVAIGAFWFNRRDLHS